MWVITSNLYLRAALIEIIVLNYRAILVPADCPDCLVIVGTVMVTPCGRCAPCRAWWNIWTQVLDSIIERCGMLAHCALLCVAHCALVSWCPVSAVVCCCAGGLMIYGAVTDTRGPEIQRSEDLRRPATMYTTTMIHLIIPGYIWIIMLIFNCMWHVATLDWGTLIVKYYFLYQFRMNTTCYKSLLQNYTELPIKVSIQQ